jgi:hypothetical protein
VRPATPEIVISMGIGREFENVRFRGKEGKGKMFKWN